MTSLEQIIRPFESGSATPSQQYFQAGQVGVPPVVLRFGRSGQGKSFSGSVEYHETNYMTQYENEQKTATFGTAF